MILITLIALLLGLSIFITVLADGNDWKNVYIISTGAMVICIILLIIILFLQVK